MYCKTRQKMKSIINFLKSVFAPSVELQEAKPYQLERDKPIPNYNDVVTTWKANRDSFYKY